MGVVWGGANLEGGYRCVHAVLGPITGADVCNSLSLPPSLPGMVVGLVAVTTASPEAVGVEGVATTITMETEGEGEGVRTGGTDL